MPRLKGRQGEGCNKCPLIVDPHCSARLCAKLHAAGERQLRSVAYLTISRVGEAKLLQQLPARVADSVPGRPGSKGLQPGILLESVPNVQPHIVHLYMLGQELQAPHCVRFILSELDVKLHLASR